MPASTIFTRTRVFGAAALAFALAAAFYFHGRDAAPPEPTALTTPNDWPGFGRTDGEQHYSPLRDISTSNVSSLGLAWHYDLPPENSLTGPVEADGKLFVTSGHSTIRAFEATTGKLLWTYDSKTRELAPTMNLRLGWGPKGIATWNHHVFVGTQDGRVISLDAETGKPVWQQRDFDPNELRYINEPPRVFNGIVIVGHGGGDVSALRGYVTAYDANTGKKLWRFYTVPGNPADGFENDAMRMAAKTWKGDWWKWGGGGMAWNAFSYDPALNLVYIGTGNGYPYNQSVRSPGGGDNLFTSSIVAVHADSGQYAWHYQVCPGDEWDCDATADMTLATLNIGGAPRKVLMQAPKNGFFYVLDRATGELLSAQPYAKVTWATKIDLKSGRPVENPGIRYNGKPGLFELWPGARGAHSWLPQAYSPRTGLVYIPEIEGGSFIGDEGVDFKHPSAIGEMAANVVPDPDLPGARRSFLKAWDPVTQSAAWSVQLPGNWPGGVLATAGNLVFQGRIDGHLTAYDARDGRVLWNFKTAAPVVAPPISYSAGGKQYITVITGNGALGGGLFSTGNAAFRTDYRLPRRVLTFVLNGMDKVPATQLPALVPPSDPSFQPNPALDTEGATDYGYSGCIVCHGWNAVGGGSAPDLRLSAYPTDQAAFQSVVKDGALVSAGMPAFPELPTEKIEAIRQYLRLRAHQFTEDQAKAASSLAIKPPAPGVTFAGIWNVVIDSPVGKKPATATYKIDGASISGTQVAPEGSLDIHGSIDGAHATWSGRAYMPFPITIEFDVTLQGTGFAGTVKTGPFGTFPVTGTRP